MSGAQVIEPVTVDPTLSYGAVRLRWCAAALWGLLRRWSVAIVVGLVVLGSGASAGLSGMGGLLALLVLPLFHAAAQAPALAALETLAHSLVGALVLVAVRPLLWSRNWAEFEAALPLERAELRRSDLTVVALALSPLVAAYVAGTASWLVTPSGESQSGRALPLVLLSLSIVLSVCWGQLILNFARWPLARRRRGLSHVAGTEVASGMRAGMLWALVLSPLRRGPAVRSSRLLMLSALSQAAAVLALALWPRFGGWWLAAFALGGLALTARLRAVVDADLGPLHESCMPLPLESQHLSLSRQGLALLPFALALALLGAVAFAGHRQFRPLALAGFMVAAFCFNLLQVLIPGRLSMSLSTRVAMWLLMLVTLVTFASEAMR